ncbi:UDP-N-acetylmuramate dehydrogenase [Pinibacter soli]|uniref:UDP-N-acetylenolpyruvoylglucosamine reductase n=1 Tax=Pinibacter soli TaxID=3044211 RepID=A0ABT6RH62_9BACT|nr:UDP-N-acetylmuramate dehydrogenase [Pinibacter soli]MDI3321895.1 UDP-N-acetylmuramate dehydrogenase [Pinibacter soli]
MQILENVSLKSYNTFGINVIAKQFTKFSTIDELNELLAAKPAENNNQMILGGGSNILFTKNFDGIVLKNEIKGIEKVAEDDDFVYVKAGSGENWHQFVLYCIRYNYAGVENLSLIPGNVGASPMQNIGAYGVEIKDVFHELEAFHLHDRKSVKFTLSDCHFGYRESVFKNIYKNQFAIANVTYKLRKQPQFNTTYGAIEQELEKMNVKDLSIQAISQAVINIRSSKLPDPKDIGNAGSFFKNPSVTTEKFESLKKEFPHIVGYPLQGNHFKLAAGWLIEQCGWKGFRKGDAGCHAKQALVLVNYGNATGKEVFDLSTDILKSVEEKFGVELEREVNIL